MPISHLPYVLLQKIPPDNSLPVSSFLLLQVKLYLLFLRSALAHLRSPKACLPVLC
jgi:hypothetical protein